MPNFFGPVVFDKIFNVFPSLQEVLYVYFNQCVTLLFLIIF